MEQKQMTPLLIVCITMLASSSLFIPLYLCVVFMEWSGWNQLDGLQLNEISCINWNMIHELGVLAMSVSYHVVFYQLAVRKGLRFVIKARLSTVLITTICAFLVLPLPIMKIFDFHPSVRFAANRQIVLIALGLITISYIVGIIYALRHYPKVKKEKAKTE